MKTKMMMAGLGLLALTGSAFAGAPAPKVRSMSIAQAARKGTVVVPKGGMLRITDKHPNIFAVDVGSRDIAILFNPIYPGSYKDVSLAKDRAFTVVEAER